MKSKSRSLIILSVLFGYVVLQFLWWEILLVKQNGQIINEKQKIVELSVSNEEKLVKEIKLLHSKKQTQTIMIVGEGTVFLLLLLFGVYKIKQSHDKENELTRQQNNFFLSITHELKTPIAAAKLQLQTLQKQKLEPTVQQELIKNALSETERLNALIDNVLLASRMESAQFVLRLESQNVSNVVDQTMTRYYKKEMLSGEIKTQLAPNCKATIDEGAFASLLTNLVDNALKYSPAEKNIGLSLEQKENKLVLSISDSGVGISASDKEKIFDKFYRIGNEETRLSKGTGLGLYIVKKLVKGHHAKIYVKDNLPKGTIFEIHFDAV